MPDICSIYAGTIGKYLKENHGAELLEISRAKLQQYNDPTAHFRMVREEVKQAAVDGKTKLQFPTGETAIKIEGLGESASFRIDNPALEGRGIMRDYTELSAGNMKVGQQVFDNGRTEWIITDVLGDGKFKAVPKRAYDSYLEKIKGYNKNQKILEKGMLDNQTEQFDISGKVDTNNPIYKFYDKTLARYLVNKYQAKRIIDDKGVQWLEVDIKPKYGKEPVEAFGKAMLSPLIIGAGVMTAGALAPIAISKLK